MTNVEDIAGRILECCGRMTTMKLQKLTFYCQAAYLGETGQPLFDGDFQAWVNGPVSPDLFAQHRRKFFINPGELRSRGEGLSDRQRGVVDAVCAKLGELNPNELVEKTHREAPWREARKDCDTETRSTVVIPRAAIEEYYRANSVL
ncbi:DUF4065 domain-containing protein [Actinotignum schaalii]|uniref:Panacea domain-containing protein n=1 Tax=Actinotignum schaalii TaxID=59505 RepID=UPI00237E4AF8|nr:type II toxin-antitoxin system antitoxin SocA domain-containing protein [Actinotignum schaalii]MDE1655212.1 DUF4065 domain-containing protein [Actinotignum schaalii]